MVYISNMELLHRSAGDWEIDCRNFIAENIVPDDNNYPCDSAALLMTEGVFDDKAFEIAHVNPTMST